MADEAVFAEPRRERATVPDAFVRFDSRTSRECAQPIGASETKMSGKNRFHNKRDWMRVIIHVRGENLGEFVGTSTFSCKV